MNLFKDVVDEYKSQKTSVKFWHTLGFVIQLSLGIFYEWGWECVGMLQFFIFFFSIAVAYDNRHKSESKNHFAVQSVATYLFIIAFMIGYGIYRLFKHPVIYLNNILKNFNNKLDKQ